MIRNREHLSSLEPLAVQWKLLGLMAVAFARQVLRMEGSDPRAARVQAQQLRCWVSAALFTLMQQVTLLKAGGAVCDEDQGRVLQRLEATTAALVLLALFATRMEQRLASLVGAPTISGNTADHFAALRPLIYAPRLSTRGPPSRHSGTV